MQQTNIKRNTPRKELHVNYTLLIIIMTLLVFGLFALYSASSVVSYTKSHTSTYYFSHQLLYGAAIGLMAMYITSKINYKFWQKYTPLMVIGVIILLVAVLLPHIGFRVGNARRWISVGPIFIQPAELAKLVLIFYIASWIDKHNNQIKDFVYGFVPSLLIIGIIAGLIILEPDIGTMLVVIITALVMLFVGGSEIKHLLWVICGGLVVFAILVKLQPYRVARFTAFLDPSVDPKGIGYQINQALVAIGSGGLWGYGYGHSRQKYNFLPEVIGDSIFAVIVEELGFIRAGLVAALYVIFAFQGVKIAKTAPDTFSKMVSIGIVSWIALEAFINIGAIMGVLPLTGVPLPFISYGSSALIVTLAAMGVLLNISKHAA